MLLSWSMHWIQLNILNAQCTVDDGFSECARTDFANQYLWMSSSPLSLLDARYVREYFFPFSAPSRES